MRYMVSARFSRGSEEYIYSVLDTSLSGFEQYSKELDCGPDKEMALWVSYALNHAAMQE